MSFVMMPIFIMGVEFTRRGYLFFILGLGLSLGLILPLLFISPFVPHITCNDMETKTASDIAWHNSCLTLQYNTQVAFPLVFVAVGVGIVIVGLVRFYLSGKSKPPIAIKNFKKDRTYPAGYSADKDTHGLTKEDKK